MMKWATLCYVRRNQQTLMLHRVKREADMHAGKWNGLGGKLLPGETPEACVIREVAEESGLQLRYPELRGLLTFPQFANQEDWYAFVFVAHEFTGRLIDSDEGVLQWIDNDKLLDLNLWAGDRVFIPWLDEPGFFSARFDYDDGRYVGHEVTFYGAQTNGFQKRTALLDPAGSDHTQSDPAPPDGVPTNTPERFGSLASVSGSATESSVGSAGEAEDETCWLCGGPVFKRHCKITCTVCGFRRDCSDP